MKMRYLLPLVAVAAAATTSCHTTNPREGALGGAAVGAVTGAILDSDDGGVGGAVAGGILGGVAGAAAAKHRAHREAHRRTYHRRQPAYGYRGPYDNYRAPEPCPYRSY